MQWSQLHPTITEMANLSTDQIWCCHSVEKGFISYFISLFVPFSFFLFKIMGVLCLLCYKTLNNSAKARICVFSWYGSSSVGSLDMGHHLLSGRHHLLSGHNHLFCIRISDLSETQKELPKMSTAALLLILSLWLVVTCLGMYEAMFTSVWIILPISAELHF